MALDTQLKKAALQANENDPCIYTQTSGGDIFIEAVYVDDIILASESLIHIQKSICFN